MSFKRGDLVRFTATFTTDGRLKSPSRVTATFSSSSGSSDLPALQLEPGVHYVDRVVTELPLTVTFSSPTGEFSSVTYPDHDEVPIVLDPSPPAPPPEPVLALDRAAARRRLARAGIETDSSWSDAKLLGALEALDSY